MLLENTSERFKELFLLAFTRELIINSSGEEILDLVSEVEKVEEQKKEVIKEAVKHELHPTPAGQFKPLPHLLTSRLPKRLIIPVSRFPPRLQYIRPTPAQTIIDLGKLNPLIQDPMVQTIESHGPDKEVIIRTPVEKKTKIVLSKEDINQIIKTFSEKTKIPIIEGVFRVAVGKLLLSSIISKVVGTKFIIKKLKYSPAQIRPSNLQRSQAFGVPPR